MPECPSCGEENKEGARFCNACGAALAEPAAPPPEVRKTVTVLFSDVTGSTALGEQHDPESMRRVMGRYFEEMRTVIERHGGTVEKFIGDAVMAIFGIPQLHEDDALRALRAATEMRERLLSLNEELGRDFGTTLQVRTGVNTGEVVAGTGETLATGDAVNVAARLEQAAQPDEILIGETTYRLVRDAVDAKPLEPVAAKGKSEPLSAFRLEALVAGAEPFARRLEGPLVGRERELALLHDAYKRAVEGQSCHLFTLLGTAGIGKSRLAQELVATVGQEATALSGRCLPYGEGITYWPLVEILEQLGSETAVVQLLEGAPDARSIVNQVFAAVGLAETAGTGEETFWAIRRLFEALARERPLVLVLDDVQWAEPTFLDLVEHVADLSRDAPILLLCLARPELLDERSSWGGGKLNATSILLEPLSEEAAGELIERLLTQVALPQRTRDRIAEAAEGNPLFVEQVIAMLAEEGGAEEEVAVPPTIHALLAARLDRLPPDERALIERAAVVGKEFWRAAIEQLMPDLTELARPLQQLVRKELIRAARSTIFPSEDAFRFRHLLIRDVAYAGMPKELRAELHERFADWLEGQVSGYDEIIGYHLEQACRYRTELGPPDAVSQELATRAGGRLGAAGMRASARGDQTAAANLLERAVSLLPADSRERLELLPELGHAWFERGELERAAAVLDEADEQAQSLDDTTAAARVAVIRIETDLLTAAITMEEGLAQAKRAAGVFEEAGDELGLAQAWHLVGRLLFWLGRSAAAEEAWEDAVAYARRAGGRREEASTLGWLSKALMVGPTPVEPALRRIEEILEEAGDLRIATAQTLICRGMLEAMHGRFDEGRAATERGRAIYEDLGARVLWASTGMVPGELELLADDGVAAERVLRPACEALQGIGDRGYLSSTSADLAEALYLQGRLEEADEWTRVSEESAAADDFESQVHWRTVRGRILARRGDVAEGERLARDALAIVEPTDWPTRRGEALIALSEILDLAERREEAAEAAEQALQLFDAKGDLASARRTRELLQEIHARVS